VSTEHLGVLGISAEQALRAAEFQIACAAAAIAEAEESEPNPDRDWVLRMDAASALRDAAQWMMLIQPARAIRSLESAGRIYADHGFGYGAFLQAGAGRPPEVDVEVMMEVLRPANRPREIPAPLQHPQQQVYLLLASAAAGNIPRQVLSGMAREAPQSLGVVPVGALGVPLRRYWEMALHLLDGDPAVVVRHLEVMSTSYAESTSLAMTNDYLWRSGAAPVDVVDLDIALITVIAMRAFGPDRMGRAVGGAGDRLPARARTPMELGQELFESFA
jgi:hypothetical protein